MNSHPPVRLFKESDYIDSLTNLCMEKILENLKKIFLVQNKPPIINPSIYLPLNFTEFLLNALNEDFNYEMVPALMSCLKNSENFPIKRINLKNIKTLNDDDLHKILTGNYVSRLIVNSTKLTNNSIPFINSKAENLTHLGLGKKCSDIFQKSVKGKRHSAMAKLPPPTDSPQTTIIQSSSPSSPPSSWSSSSSSSSSSSLLATSSQSQLSEPSIFQLPNLQILSVNVKHPDVLSIFDYFDLTSFAHKLTVLDLSDCSAHICFEKLLEFTQLKFLSLHNIIFTKFEDTLSIIQHLSTLKSLDLGMSYRDEPYCYKGDVVGKMTELLRNLRELNSLEICGTNLAGIKAIQPISMRMKMMDEVPGIDWLTADRRLHYLGLLNCADQPCIRENIYADIVSGNETIDQILVSLERYDERMSLYLLSLNRFFEVIRNEILPPTLQARALEAILRGMKKYFEDNGVQISGSASLFYLVKGDLKEYLPNRVKRRIIKVLLDAMESFNWDNNMARNGCLTLCHFRFPTDLLHDYTRVVNVLLRIVSNIELPSDVFVHRVALNLLNSLACQVDKPEKVILGQLPTFEVILNLVAKRIEADKCDELMEVAWSLMWNATDETAPNCDKFIEHGGLQIFTKCLKTFPDSDELLRNMMGLLGNVAEVQELRRLLMEPLYLDTFISLLDSKCDGIEVSYNACGVLANLMSDGEEAWVVEGMARGEVAAKMHHAINHWPIDSERNINYRSFKPILRLLDCGHTPVVLYWAAWALCNLTKVYRRKYCPLLLSEGGVEKLKEVYRSRREEDIRSLCARVVRRCRRQCRNPHADASTDDEEEDEEGVMAEEEEQDEEEEEEEGVMEVDGGEAAGGR